jgi:hypothetical protein
LCRLALTLTLRLMVVVADCLFAKKTPEHLAAVRLGFISFTLFAFSFELVP